MLTLAATDTLQGSAGTATAVTYTILGMELAAGVETYKRLAGPLQLPTSAGVLYTVPASTTAFVKTILLANTTASAVAIVLYINGTAAANQILSVPVPANGEAVFNQDGWKVYDSNGNLQTVSQGYTPTTRTLTAGAGLTGGGDLSADRTFNVVANADGSIVVAADDVKVGVLATDAQHGNRGNGALHTAATTSLAGFMAAADKVFQAAQQSAEVLVTNNAYANLAFDGVTDDLAQWNALLAAVPDKSVLKMPNGTTRISNAVSIPSGKHLSFRGAGQDKTYVLSTHQTADHFTVNDWLNTFEGMSFITPSTTISGATALSGSPVTVTVGSTTNFGASGSCYMQTNLGWTLVAYTGKGGTTLTGCTAAASTTVNGGTCIFKTAGFAVQAGTMSYIFVRFCNFNGCFNGFFNGGTLCGIEACNFASTINFSMQFNGGGVNGYVDRVTCDGIPAAAAHIEVNLCGSLLIANSDLIRAVNNLRINPSSSGCFSIYCTNCFFDSATGSAVKFMGSSDIQRVKFTNCWCSGSVNGIEFAGATGTNSTTGVDIVNCDIYSNSANGILATTVRDFSVAGSRISNNTTAGVNLSAAAGSITTFNIQNNTIGPTGISGPGSGPNGQGVLINAGTYASYIVTGNTVQGNTSNLNVVDNGTVATTDLKQINDNTGHLLSGAISSLTAPLTVPLTTETLVLNARIPANSVIVGQVFRVKAIGITSGGGLMTFRVRVGALGTAAGDAQGWISIATVAQAANERQYVEALVTVRSLGAPGSVQAEGHVIAHLTATTAGALPTVVAAVATAAATTTAAWFIDLTAVCATAGTWVCQHAVIEAL